MSKHAHIQEDDLIAEDETRTNTCIIKDYFDM